MKAIWLSSFVGIVMVPITLLLSVPVYAQDLTVSGNGDHSTSHISVSSATDQSVNQSNTAQVSNQVTPSQNSGSNSASNNTAGSSSVTTGNDSSSSEVKNRLNDSKIDHSSCCQQNSATATIAGNGDNSDNKIKVDTTNTTDIKVNQNATVTNLVNSQADSGHDKAEGNNGDVNIQTGDILISQKVLNQQINQSENTISSPASLNLTIKIKNNGPNSQNKLEFKQQTENQILTNNSQALENILTSAGISGQNTVNKNVGDISISTGSIKTENLLQNVNLNLSKISSACCANQTQSGGGGTTGGSGGGTNGSGGTGGNGGGSGGAGGSGGGDTSSSGSATATSSVSVGGTSVGTGGGGEILAATIMPATGNFWMLYLNILAGLMFLLGIYLRFHPGLDPPQQNLSF